MKRTALALAALAAATVALAQQTAPSAPGERCSIAILLEWAAPPADSSTRMSDADRQALMNKCVTQVQAANPSVPEKDIRAYCDREIKNLSSPQ